MKIAELVERLENAGVEIRKIECIEDKLDIDCSPYEIAVEVFKDLGYIE